MEFHNLDKNNDGVLGFNELVEGIENSFGIPKENAEKHVEDIFVSLDKNKNGFLDYSEFKMGTMAVNKIIS